MKELLKNKKTLIPILLGIAIIVIAIVTFIVMGTSRKAESRVSVVKLDNTQPTTNELGNTYSNETKNEVKNETKNEVENQVANEIDEDKDFDVDEFYQDAAKTLVKGFTDEDEVQKFIEEYFDPKAYAAYESVEFDDSRFYEEYTNFDDNDERIEEITEKILDMTTDADLKIILEDISEPEISDQDENITKITITVSVSDQEQEIDIVFYDTVVIYIMDSEGNSFLDGVQWMEEE